jgi:hypothetical protein
LLHQVKTRAHAANNATSGNTFFIILTIYRNKKLLVQIYIFTIKIQRYKLKKIKSETIKIKVGIQIKFKRVLVFQIIMIFAIPYFFSEEWIWLATACVELL